MFAKARARTTMLVAAAVVMVAAAGCASAGKAMFKEPVVTLKELKLNGLGLTGGSIDVVLNVYNPNGFNLDATRMTYKLMIDSIPFGTGLIEQRFAVAKNDSNTVRIPVNFTYMGVGEAGRQLIQTGTMNYRVTGDVTVGTPLGNYTVPYDRAGRFSPLSGAR